ncbi:molybdopterin-guanine dinucleotide biosynthesis protein A [Candidatus Magnetomorum sp. HK-1]|nr:molybdopterin-guanine dinucleotide biosynthesis protein A [Candidatus Magnetomorum sp. HK-1]
MNKKFPISGVILAGGKNSRVDGKNKTFFPIGSASIFERIYSVMNCFFDDLMVVTRSPERFLAWDISIVADIYKPYCSLNGIYSGLFYSLYPQAFVVACDTPFLSHDLIEYMCKTYNSKLDVYLPRTHKGDEPLCAIYSRRCLNPFKSHLQLQKYKITRCFKSLKTDTIEEETLRSRDERLLSFFNVNTSDDLAYANTLI